MRAVEQNRSIWGRTLRHLRERSLPDRLDWRIRQFRRFLREERWRRHRGSDGMFVVQLQPSVRMHLYYDSELSYLIDCRDFEAAERQFVRAYLRPGDIFIDAGANIGLFTLIAAHAVTSDGRVLAFEPTAATFKRLQENVALNRFANVIAFQEALSDRSGTLLIRHSAQGFDAWNTPVADADREPAATEEVNAVRLDDVVAERLYGRRIAMMKIDVEGWESYVLQGGRECLSRPDAPLLQVEFTDAAAHAAGKSCQELYSLIRSLGYTVCRFDQDRHELIVDPLRDHYPYVNLFATKDVEYANSRLSAAAEFVG